ncbi:hypothetical protein [Falsirhodobacter algicola]|uniref:Uncharacterized protein n=1 Tax=Falsirhodobacter algicola TaxID=2692330 RepID=A0A8J8SLN3_9RHOB|nr:hypothetical protein [Falsirhodobacter algicola]QUS36599.1 hypothetical protein GR316_10190 [Falsirhodobacter algicola]
MRHPSLDTFIASGSIGKGPVAIIMADDAVELASTVEHHRKMGFGTILLPAHPDLPVPMDLEAQVHRIDHDVHARDALMEVVNSLIPVAPGTWFYAGFNAEYLFFPFCETRDIRELIAYHMEERRDAFLSYVIDLYAGDLQRFPNAVSVAEAQLDRSGYYALARPDPATGHPRERQLDFFGGLRWRFEEHIPVERRKIDRIALFRAKEGLILRPDFTFNDEEYNTYSCAWHHNPTVAVCSFRIAKALRSNPGSRHLIRDFGWHYSSPFEWSSQQLMDLGLIEPGQWV